MRLFHCTYCGHKLRFRQTACSQCYQPTPYYNRLRFWLILALAVLAAAAAFALSLVV